VVVALHRRERKKKRNAVAPAVADRVTVAVQGDDSARRRNPRRVPKVWRDAYKQKEHRAGGETHRMCLTVVQGGTSL